MLGNNVTFDVFYFLCLRFGIDYVPAALDLPHSSYKASGYHNTNWYPRYMRLDHYLGWMPPTGDVSPWLQIDMLNVYTMIGLYLKKSTTGYYVTLFHLKASIDGNTHYYIEQNIVPDYLMNEVYSTYWFDNATSGRYWTIEPVHGQYEEYPYIGGDFIGYL